MPAREFEACGLSCRTRLDMEARLGCWTGGVGGAGLEALAREGTGGGLVVGAKRSVESGGGYYARYRGRCMKAWRGHEEAWRCWVARWRRAEFEGPRRDESGDKSAGPVEAGIGMLLGSGRSRSSERLCRCILRASLVLASAHPAPRHNSRPAGLYRTDYSVDRRISLSQPSMRNPARYHSHPQGKQKRGKGWRRRCAGRAAAGGARSGRSEGHVKCSGNLGGSVQGSCLGFLERSQLYLRAGGCMHARAANLLCWDSDSPRAFGIPTLHLPVLVPWEADLARIAMDFSVSYLMSPVPRAVQNRSRPCDAATLIPNTGISEGH